jgi:ubiquinone/menaquinone biosynthesis C-methylase UbiE
MVNLRKKSFIRESHPQYYIADRGMNKYLKELPDFQGRDIKGHILNRVNKNEKVSILDVGCGAGAFLVDAFKLNPQHVQVSGITAFDYRNMLYPNEQKIALKHIEYRIGDAQKIKEIFEGKRFDFIASVWTLGYVGDPLNVLRKCYSLLNTNGVLFVDKIPNRISKEDARKLQDYWTKRGIESEFRSFADFSLAVKKNDRIKKLPLPFGYSTEDNYYKFNGEYKLPEADEENIISSVNSPQKTL